MKDLTPKLIETIEGNLSQGMRQLNGVYTQTFNRRHGRVGHVYQGRYKAILVERETYLLELSRYVVLNPVRAGMVKQVDDWPWSSYLGMIRKADAPDWLETDWLLSHFSKQRKRAIAKYIDFVRDGMGLPSIWENLQHQIYLGGERFIKKHQKEMEKLDSLDEIPALQRRAKARPLGFYEKKYRTRDKAITAAYLTGDYSMKEIGEHFGRHYSTISRIIKQNE